MTQWKLLIDELNQNTQVTFDLKKGITINFQDGIRLGPYSTEDEALKELEYYVKGE